MIMENINTKPHRRKNILTGEWILVSPHRTQRPWQGEIAKPDLSKKEQYIADCYLCPGNKRANGDTNPDYKDCFVFTNDFSALLENVEKTSLNNNNLLVAESEKGICRVVNFSPRHDLTLAEMEIDDIVKVINVWQEEFRNLASVPGIKNIQIFENKGGMMGNSNPHPHGQIWAQKSIPNEPAKELENFNSYYTQHGKSLLEDYLALELKLDERIVFQNNTFVVLVPFWAVWPYETMIVSRRKLADITGLTEEEKKDFAEALSTITAKYDNLFNVSFPYSAGMHQAPVAKKKNEAWHFHMHFYPPLLRSATIKKFMVGYEMLAEPQRDITPEYSAKVLRDLSSVHYSKRSNE